MPYVKLQTNLEMDAEQSVAVIKKLSTYTAEILGKPESSVQAVMDPVPHIIFGGREQASAFIDLRSVGLTGEKTPDVAARLGEFLQNELGIGPDMAYIAFTNISREMWGFKGCTL